MSIDLFFEQKGVIVEVQSLTVKRHPHELVENLIGEPVKSHTQKNSEKFHPANTGDFMRYSEIHGHLPSDIEGRG